MRKKETTIYFGGKGAGKIFNQKLKEEKKKRKMKRCVKHIINTTISIILLYIAFVMCDVKNSDIHNLNIVVLLAIFTQNTMFQILINEDIL